ncbi:phosphodiester glycosidase family protein [Aurantiacibacter poecillastricola]|uniref:phosphodiester glycosidase family protein n=1 Tax=Aurantiacibacter poecillastricola TaxID=3064385 RepID=UPI00273D8496|nr:phosphodiester glycosidase family protein [Aurantiacibacter sp. 219JJ12-13]MDP5262095.1 phosphodiester glycosidase family protein [Aurantiacibacter sp. 219JJ12-13]
MTRAVAALALLALAACSIRTEGEETQARSSICEPIVYEDSPFTHCVAEPDEHLIAMDLAPSVNEEPYRSVAALEQALRDEAEDVALAMNGGMFDTEGKPIGYYVEDGDRLTVLNQNEGPGNFHLLPNGVFFGETERGPWRVWDTERFAREIENRPQFATQSGPMLVIEGQLHPDFAPDGDSRKIRNAVGVDAAGRAHFVISEAPVSFGKLARLYRDVLNVNNALFLDGSVSQLWDPAKDRVDAGAPIGPIILVRQQEPVQ